ncbi:MAG: hypothetical protein QOE96_149 [Blastocatellia bacterium]|jgi:hypothetical protein|nr:hypothetical protein [Blastocatellia bacterium]
MLESARNQRSEIVRASRPGGRAVCGTSNNELRDLNMNQFYIRVGS